MREFYLNFAKSLFFAEMTYNTKYSIKIILDNTKYSKNMAITTSTPKRIWCYNQPLLYIFWTTLTRLWWNFQTVKARLLPDCGFIDSVCDYVPKTDEQNRSQLDKDGIPILKIRPDSKIKFNDVSRGKWWPSDCTDRNGKWNLHF